MAERYRGPYSPDPAGQPKLRAERPGATPGLAGVERPGKVPPSGAGRRVNQAAAQQEAPQPRAPGAESGIGQGRAGGPFMRRRKGLGQDAVPEPMRARRNLLWLAPLPLVITAFSGGALTLACNLLALASLWGGAWLTGQGVRAQAAYDARPVARRPALPRKILGAAATGLGVALAALRPGQIPLDPVAALLAPLIFGLVALGLHLAAFGPDPLRDKWPEGSDDFQNDRVQRLLEEAEGHLAIMREAIARTGDGALIDRVESFQQTARAMFARVESDPRDLNRARRYFGVYLMGARDAAVKFSDLWLRAADPADRAAFAALLDDLEANFAAGRDSMLGNDRADLGIEIEVLRDRLAREGLAAKR